MSHHEAACCKAIDETLAASPKKAGALFLKLIDLVRANIEGLRLALPTEDECVVFVIAQYDKHIAPIDVPWIPGNLEPDSLEAKYFDPAARWTLTQTVRAVYPG